MRFIKILSVFTLLVVSKFAFAQAIKLEIAAFTLVPNDNGVILLNYNEPTEMWASFTVSRPLSGTWPTVPIKAEINMYFDNANSERISFDVINVSNSDWLGQQYAVSKAISKGITMPAGAVTIAKPNTYLEISFRYYKEGYPFPNDTDGWSEWQTFSQPMKLNPNKIPESTLTGPISVCDEGIYTITNPYTVSLENATGIATLTALGNNQWKVTRTGTANGVVKLRSTLNGKTFDKEIIIGGGLVTGIQGPDNVNGGHSYVLDALTEGLGTIQWQYNSPYINSIGYSGNAFEFYTSEILQNQKNIKIPITAKFTSTCGTVTTITKTLTLNP